ncbi:MAG: TetR/AcrR family transcriptional regulator [Eubacteriaceae bacterium]|nr:TetR/AcrR family transcriptional regulator [Eubacteriaceae bacterium]
MENKKSKITSQKLLDISTELFYENGFDGTKIREISRLAKINHSLIYYYFPNGKTDVAYKLIAAHSKRCLKILREHFKTDSYLFYTLVSLRFISREILANDRDMMFYIEAWSEYRPKHTLFIENYTAAKELSLPVDAHIVKKSTLMGDSVWSGLYRAKLNGIIDLTHKEIRDATDITRWTYMGLPLEKIKSAIEEAEKFLEEIPIQNIRLLRPE